MENDNKKLEGGADDVWFHDDIDGELDDEWRETIGEVIRRILAEKKVRDPKIIER